VKRTLRVGIIGCGAIGSFLVKSIINDQRFKIVGLIDEKSERANKLAGSCKSHVTVCPNINSLLKKRPQVIVEVASPIAVEQYGSEILRVCDLILMSVAAFVVKPGLFESLGEIATHYGRRIYIPSGAISGLDALKALSPQLEEVILETTKHPKSIAQTSYLDKKSVELDKLQSKTVIFDGSAMEGAKYFPFNLNVAAALSYAGIGPEKTHVMFIADPMAKCTTHKITMKSPAGQITTEAMNRPSPENPRTSFLAALSVLSTLKQLVEPYCFM
jgi:aspartate dehydrogenase